MDVYIEYVIIGNLLIDSLIAYITLSFLKIRCNLLRVALSAVVGTSLAVVLPLVEYNWLIILLKIVVLPITVLLMAHYNGVKKYLSAMLIYMAVTAMLGGIVYILRAITTQKVYYTLISPNSVVPAYCAGGIILLMYTIRQIKGIASRKAMQGYECKVDINVKNYKVSCEGYIDSGNTLLSDGKGVPVIDRRLAKQLISNGATKEGGIWVKTISGEAYLKTIHIDSIKLYGNDNKPKYDITAAVAVGKLSKYRVILPVNI